MPTINLSIALVTGGMREKDGKMKRAPVIILPVQIDTPLGRAYGHTTMFLCGPSKCEHDYSRYEPIPIADALLAHKPKPKSKPARKRARRAKKMAKEQP